MDLVSIVDCSNYSQELVETAIRKSFDEIERIDFIKGSNVLIKPNLIGPYSPEEAATTHPSIVESLINIFQESNLNVFLGESSGFRAKHGTRAAFRKSGLAEVAERKKVEIIDFDKDEHINLDVYGTSPLNHIRVSKRLVEEIDYVINVPKLKTHSLTGYTGAIKNMFGIIPGNTKTNLHSVGKTLEGFSRILVDIYQTLPPHLVVMDAIVGMEGKGPTHGNPKETGYVLTSKNGAALDFVASTLIGFNPFDLEVIKIAKERGLFNENEIEGINEIPFVKYKLPKIGGMSSFGFMAKLMKPKFNVDSNLCKRCYQCYDACPEKAISKNKETGYPEWDRDKCIACYCCEELCQYDAVKMKKPLTKKIVDFLTGRFKNESNE